MKTWLLLTALLSISFSQSSIAQDDRVEIVTADVEETVLEGLVHGAEEASEGGEGASSKNKIVAFIQEYGSKLNLPKVVLGMYRWYNVQESKYPEIAADLSLMLLASHTSETLSGPVGVAAAKYLDASAWVQWTIGIGGGILSIPGLDIVCIGLGFCYIKYPKFRSGVTTTRVFIMNGVKAVGIDRFFAWFVQKQSRVDFIRKALESESGKYTYLLSVEDGEPGMTYEFKNPQGEIFARVDFGKTDATFVDQIWFFSEASESVSSSDFSKMLGLFNLNVSIGMAKAYKAYKNGKLNGLSSEYHVTNVMEVGQVTNIQFRERTLKLTDKRSWSDPVLRWFGCNSALEGSK